MLFSAGRPDFLIPLACDQLNTPPSARSYNANSLYCTEKVRKDKIQNYKELVRELKEHAGLASIVESALGRGGLVASDEVKRKVADEVVAYVEEILRDSGL